MTALDLDSRRMLRTLGSAALRIADGHMIERDWLIEQFTSGTQPNEQNIGGRLLTITEACARLRISKWSLYRLIHQQQLATVTIGRRRFVPVAEADRFVKQLVKVGGRP
ncbi:helix-turn-helix domain-containing protein [Nocardia sp. BMG111209]|uniref:helix-turn-helix domain-containing protein n=1 Tax=Nocardia sp. BMG111209 TaxID=1160137 RepID=UPI0018CAED2D|nr:helix-turn-helix domain-containing protein [Nocardia sp. BMG111209]